MVSYYRSLSDTSVRFQMTMSLRRLSTLGRDRALLATTREIVWYDCGMEANIKINSVSVNIHRLNFRYTSTLTLI